LADAHSFSNNYNNIETIKKQLFMFAALLFSQQLNNLKSLLFWESHKKSRLATSRPDWGKTAEWLHVVVGGYR
jgi:hypothetical protein